LKKWRKQGFFLFEPTNTRSGIRNAKEKALALILRLTGMCGLYSVPFIKLKYRILLFGEYVKGLFCFCIIEHSGKPHSTI
jgi:hypothetical protein